MSAPPRGKAKNVESLAPKLLHKLTQADRALRYVWQTEVRLITDTQTMFRSKLQSAAAKLGGVATAGFLLLLSAAVLTFGFFLSLSLLATSIIWGLFARRRTTASEHSVISLSKADYQNISQ